MYMLVMYNIIMYYVDKLIFDYNSNITNILENPINSLQIKANSNHFFCFALNILQNKLLQDLHRVTHF